MTIPPTNLEDSNERPRLGSICLPAQPIIRPLAVSYAFVRRSRVSAIEGLNACRRFAARRGWHIPEWLEFVEPVDPRGYVHRTNWRSLRAQLKKRDITAVFVYEPDISRERHRALLRGFRKTGIQLYCLGVRSWNGWRREFEEDLEDLDREDG